MRPRVCDRKVAAPRTDLQNSILDPSNKAIAIRPLTAVNEVGTREVGTREVDAREVGTREVGAREVGTREVGTREVGTRLDRLFDGEAGLDRQWRVIGAFNLGGELHFTGKTVFYFELHGVYSAAILIW